MYRQFARTLCLGAIALVAGCGEAPQAPSEASAPVQQQIGFTGFAEPAAGRFQIMAGPLAAISLITQDHNGDPLTASSGTLQLYSSNVAFASGGVGYLSGCDLGSPEIMYADVEVLTGFKEQLRNVYVRITSVSGGQTFCGPKDSAGTFTGSLNPNIHLYRYDALDAGPQGQPRRSRKWGLQLPDNGAFWFDGQLWAEIVPALPSITGPTNGRVFRTRSSTYKVSFAWTEDKTADGTTPAGSLVALPTGRGSELAIRQCNAVSTGAFDPAACLTIIRQASVTTNKQATATVPVGYWYQWTLRPAFRLPGSNVTTVGSQAINPVFQVVAR